MRTRTEYSIVNNTIVISNKELTIEDIRLIINETQRVVICSSMQKSNVSVSTSGGNTIINVPTDLCVLETSDQITIEYDDCVEIAKQGDNPNATNSVIYESVKTITSVESDIADGKTKLSLAIQSKGVPSDRTDSLVKMANDVISIPQQLNTKESDFGSFVAPSEYMWNVFEIARDLQNDNSHPEMGAFFVAEYYRGYDSLVLTGADAYLTCDGDYYAPLDKTAEVNHIWHDTENGKSNRYVVFYYMQDGYTFSNATLSICPRRVALSGRCASFIVSGENRLTDVYVLGTLEHFEGGTTGNSWNPAQVIRHYTAHSGGSVYTEINNAVSILLPELKTVSTNLLSGSVSGNIQLPSLTALNASIINSNVAISNYDNNLMSVSADSLEIIPSSVVAMYFKTSYTMQQHTITGLHSVMFRSLKMIDGELLYIYQSYYSTSLNSSYAIENLKSINLPSVEDISGKMLSIQDGNLGVNFFDGLTKISLPILKRCNGYIIYYTGTNGFVSNKRVCDNLVDIEVGEMETNLNLRYWRPDVTLSTTEGIATINVNIRNHIAARVSDRTGLSALTFTVSTKLYNNLEQATKDAFTAKGWIVAGA